MTGQTPPLPPGYQLAEDTPPLPAGYQIKPATSDQSFLSRAWEGFGKNVLPAENPLAPYANRLFSGIKGTLEALSPVPTAQERQDFGPLAYTPLSLQATRLAHGQVEAEKQLGPQFVQQAEGAARERAAQPRLQQVNPLPTMAELRATTTGLAMLDPFASASVANVNRLQAEGRPGQAAQEGLADVTMLAAPEAAARSIAPRAAISDTAHATQPAHVEALTGFLKTTKTDPFSTASVALPEARAVAAREGINIKSIQGRTGAQKVIGRDGIFHKAIQEHRAQYAALRRPHESVPLDTTPIAKAYLDKITPEMRANDPQAVNRLTAEARKFADVNDQGEVIGVKPQPLSQIDAFRERLNNELDAYEQKPLDKQIRSDIEVRADKAAVDASRDLVYQTLAARSGIPEAAIREMQRRQGALIEARRDLTQAFNQASGSQGEAIAGSLRANPEKVFTAREKAGHLYPSRHGVERSTIRELVSPKPLDVFNNRLRMMFSDLPAGAGSKAAAPPISSQQPFVSNKTGGGQIAPPFTYAEQLPRLRSELKQARQAGDAESVAYFERAIAQAEQLGKERGMRSVPQLPRAPAATPAAASVPTRPVSPPVKPSSAAELSAQRQATLIMLQAKRGEISSADADRRIQRLVGSGGRRTVRRPQGPD